MTQNELIVKCGDTLYRAFSDVASEIDDQIYTLSNRKLTPDEKESLMNLAIENLLSRLHGDLIANWSIKSTGNSAHLQMMALAAKKLRK